MWTWIINTLKGQIQGLVTNLVPGFGLALKVGPWIAIGILAAFLAYEHQELLAQKADVALETGRVSQAISQCQSEAAQRIAKANADSLNHIKASEAAANAAEASLTTFRSEASAEQATAQTALANDLQAISTQAAQPGQDGTIPPVLARMFGQ